MPEGRRSTTHAPAPAAFGRDLWLSFLSNLLFALGLGLYYQLLNVYAIRNLGAPRFMIGALVAIQLGMTAIGYIPGAWAADHVRLKPIIVAVWWLTVPTALSFALAPSWPWLIPGYLLTGLYMANNPAFKVYIMLKSEPARMARNISYVFASFPLGMALGPLAGGWLATRYGMRLVFVVAIGFYVASSIVISLIKDTPYHAAGRPWRLADLLANRVFRRNLIFFFGGFFMVYLAQPFVQPYLAQVHHLGYTALGVLAGIGALGGSAITFVAGRTTDVYGHRRGIGLTIACVVLGAALLLAGWAPPVLGSGGVLLRRVRLVPVRGGRHREPLVRLCASCLGLRGLRRQHGTADGRRGAVRRSAVSRSLRVAVRRCDLPRRRPAARAGAGRARAAGAGATLPSSPSATLEATKETT